MGARLTVVTLLMSMGSGFANIEHGSSEECHGTEECHGVDILDESSVELLQLPSKAKSAAETDGVGMWEATTWEVILAEIAANSSASACDSDTYGTCSVTGCALTRGPTKCVTGKCLCADGHCAKGGKCFPQAGKCLEDTGGSCKVGSCKKSRGATKCKSAKCLCKQGGCAWKGTCFPVTDTGGSCNTGICDASRGPTICHSRRCLCKDGYVTISGRCEKM